MNQEAKTNLYEAFNRLKAGEPQAAQAILIPILKSDPNLAEAWYLLSFSVQEDQQKIYALRRALQINPNFEDAQVRLITLEKETTQPEKLPTIKDIDTDQQFARVQDFLNDGNLEAAQRMLRGIIRSDSQNHQAWYLFSFATSHHREQVIALTQALRIDPDFEDARLRLQQLQTPLEKVEPVFGEALPVADAPSDSKKTTFRTFRRIAKYSVVKGITLFFTVAVGVYITILIANMGGYIDEIVRGQIAQTIMGMAMAGTFDDIPEEERDATLEQLEWEMEESRGLHEPFVLRTFVFLADGLTLNFGELI